MERFVYQLDDTVDLTTTIALKTQRLTTKNGVNSVTTSITVIEPPFSYGTRFSRTFPFPLRVNSSPNSSNSNSPPSLPLSPSPTTILSFPGSHIFRHSIIFILNHPPSPISYFQTLLPIHHYPRSSSSTLPQLPFPTTLNSPKDFRVIKNGTNEHKLDLGNNSPLALTQYAHARASKLHTHTQMKFP